MSLYSSTAVQKLIEKYQDMGGEVLGISEGVLGWGQVLLYDLSAKLCFFVIKEQFLNEWSSAHTIRKYHKIPKKYMNLIVKNLSK